jgi:hypothetical protein
VRNAGFNPAGVDSKAEAHAEVHAEAMRKYLAFMRVAADTVCDTESTGEMA